MAKKAYRSVLVKQVRLSQLCGLLPGGPLHVGVDIGKHVLLVVLRDSGGSFQRPWKVVNPHELKLLTGLLRELSEQHELQVAMESTGTYGDAFRQCLADAGLVSHRVNAKAVRDSAELFDGVPSQHDGKDAAIIADLASRGLAQPWPLERESSELKTDVAWLDAQQGILQRWLGRLESLLARHWPELTELMDLSRPTLLRLLAHYGDPAALVADEQAAARLYRWGRNYLKHEKIELLLASARNTLGVRLDKFEAQFLRNCAGEALAAVLKIRQTERKLRALARENAELRQEAEVVGRVTACVLRAAVGDPRKYHCGHAYRKAMGLNLKEHSSGKHQGQLSLTKRGPSIARRWLYFAALRAIKQGEVKPWYLAKKARDSSRGNKAVIGVMRKLALALYAVAADGETFSLARLLPGLPAPSGKRRNVSEQAAD
jgi:transposase